MSDSNPKPKRRPIVDRRRMTDSHRKSEERIEALKDKLAIDVHKEGERTLDAVRATFDDAIWANRDERSVVRLIFSTFCAAATAANARLIANHPDCPESVREEVAKRASSRRRGPGEDGEAAVPAA